MFSEDDYIPVNDMDHWEIETAQLTTRLVAEASKSDSMNTFERCRETERFGLDYDYESRNFNATESLTTKYNLDGLLASSMSSNTDDKSNAFGFHDINTKEYVNWRSIFYPELRSNQSKRPLSRKIPEVATVRSTMDHEYYDKVKPDQSERYQNKSKKRRGLYQNNEEILDSPASYGVL